jgi:hypothetical protein
LAKIDVFLPKLSPANILGLNMYRKSSKDARQNKLLGLGDGGHQISKRETCKFENEFVGGKKRIHIWFV